MRLRGWFTAGFEDGGFGGFAVRAVVGVEGVGGVVWWGSVVVVAAEGIGVSCVGWRGWDG